MASPSELKESVLKWLEENQWRGIDPFDGLNSPLWYPIVNGFLASVPGVALLRLAILQAVKRSPWNLRPLLLVRPQENAMSWAVGALGALADATRDPGTEALAERTLRRLLSLRDRTSGLWGYPFPWQARAFYLRPNEPNLVISAVCLRALADGASYFSTRNLGLAQELSAALEKGLSGVHQYFHRKEGFFSYVSHKAVLVHNANLLAIESFFYAERLGLKISANCFADAREALTSTLRYQEANGRWSYGTSGHHAWGDNFHTAYNLVSLARIHDATADSAVRASCAEAIRRGTPFYLQRAFTARGDARYFDNQTWPLETHSAAAALVCLGELSSRGWIDTDQAKATARLTLQATEKSLYLGGGKFAYRRWPCSARKTVFARWTQAWMYYGLAQIQVLLP